MTIVFSCIARGPTILCSHSSSYGNYDEVARSMLPNIPTRNDHRKSYSSNDIMFHVSVVNGIIYMCAAEQDFGKRMPYGFLDEIHKRFSNGSLVIRANTAVENELNRDFEQVLSTQMQRFSRGDDSMNALQSQVDEVKGIMTQNIEKVLQRGEGLDDLMGKTEDLEASSTRFATTAKKVRRKMWWKNMKMKLCIGGTVLIVIIIIVIVILFSTGVLPPKGGGTSGNTTMPAITAKR
ncbi:vesicle-associated membrane protein 7-like [Lineus longissimus]|uniref:vesicle-associated membrane protein 7-like n=1 Tax=Lineus longissimus TaxID=88925 RepID=UPI002B4F4BFC